MKKRISFVIGLCLSLCFIWNAGQAQRSYNEYGGSLNQHIYDLAVLPSGGYFFTGSSAVPGGNSLLWMGTVDGFGNMVWDSVYDYEPGVVSIFDDIILPLPNGNFWVTTKTLPNFSHSVLEVTPMGDIVFETNFSGGEYAEMDWYSLAPSTTGTGGFMLNTEFFTTSNANGVLGHKFDDPGNNWTVTFSEPGIDYGFTQLLTSQFGYYQVLLISQNTYTVQRVNANGVKANTFALPDSIGTAWGMAEAANGDIIVAGHGLEGDFTSLRVARYDTLGNQLFFKRHLNGALIDGLPLVGDLEVNDEGNIICTGYYGLGGSSYDLFIIEMDANGEENWSHIYDFHEHADIGLKVLPKANGYTFAGSTYNNFFQSQGLIIETDSTGTFFNHLIEGRITETATPCVFDASGKAMSNWIVRAESNFVQYTNTDSSGYYKIFADTGDYQLSTYPIGYWNVCDDTVDVSIQTLFDTTTINFAADSDVDCPLMTVELSNNRMRICSQATYLVSYANAGTVDAADAYVEVTLDSLLTFDSASIDPISQVGQVLRFDLGTVPYNAIRSFVIYVSTPCDVENLGLSVCSQAHIYPDTVCALPLWGGPLLELDGACKPDGIEFTIENIGAAMLRPHQYIVIEDNIILMTSNTELDEGEIDTIPITPNEGSVYHLLVAQDPDLPVDLGNPTTYFTLFPCSGNNNGLFFNDFPYDYGLPYVSLSCEEIIGAYDPNDKTPTPRGWRSERYIDNSTDISYKIRFQNTGTDTAFRVQIVDTLSKFLDPATIRPGGSSHPYRFDLVGEGIAVFTFEPIALPDSGANQEASNGYVEFLISQQQGLEDGTQILNDAAIYFDFNPPIITNTTSHTVGMPLVRVLTHTFETSKPAISLQVAPNPAVDQATIQVVGTQTSSGLYELFDQQGRRIRQAAFQGDQVTVSVSDLHTGVYLLRISDGQRFIGSAKLLVTR